MAKKITAPNNTVTRDMNALCEPVGNVYETVRIIAKRANQISAEVKQELDKKLADFASSADNLEEVFKIGDVGRTDDERQGIETDEPTSCEQI